MKVFIAVSILISSLVGCAQNRKVGGPCEGCEAIFEYNQKLNAIDTIPGFLENSPKIKVTGVVYQKDGKTPARDIIVYFYHTNRKGVYPTIEGQGEWGRRHGKHRGWVKTGSEGSYTFLSFQPAPYPGRNSPAHIHLTVKEPDVIPYYIDDILFRNDPLLTESQIQSRLNRGGAGITDQQPKEGQLTVIKRDIVLGLNIPNYE